ncbi:hypothetical protein BRADI_1g43116v3 [Brachypodium distachyon]|uniref:Uncharacterized protein n=1 Tax=Brachypodium distachyon TaxID=15368 RepID=A0A2K2DP21_BRADI|nr:hypothetical protein BRADI_1g43116v3 [Brachypodium distachyon]
MAGPPPISSALQHLGSSRQEVTPLPSLCLVFIVYPFESPIALFYLVCFCAVADCLVFFLFYRNIREEVTPLLSANLLLLLLVSAAAVANLLLFFNTH